MTVSILMPTFNQSKYIRKSVDSVLNQKLKDWQLIIVDGCSTDNTEALVKEYKDKRITYIRKPENPGQLNGLFEASKHIQGEYVTMLHSDDFYHEQSLANTLYCLQEHPTYDGVYADLVEVDEEDNRVRELETPTMNSSLIGKLFLRLGSNQIGDPFFVTIQAFWNTVYPRYILWNTPYWLITNGQELTTLRLMKGKPWYFYRKHKTGNYVNKSPLARSEVVNGCLRTVLDIGRRYRFPFLKAQLLTSRLFKRKTQVYFKQDSSMNQLPTIVSHFLKQHFPVLPNNEYYKALKGFYENFEKQRTLTLDCDVPPIEGKDAFTFFRLLENKKLPDSYYFLLDEATRGFSKIKTDMESIRTTLRFLNLVVR